jgi:hypothetical protein
MYCRVAGSIGGDGNSVALFFESPNIVLRARLHVSALARLFGETFDQPHPKALRRLKHGKLIYKVGDLDK